MKKNSARFANGTHVSGTRPLGLYLNIKSIYTEPKKKGIILVV